MASNAHNEFDVWQKFVRVTGIRNNSFVEFDFSVGSPELYAELILPFEAFREFCAQNEVSFLTPEQAAAVDLDRLKWRFGKPGITE